MRNCWANVVCLLLFIYLSGCKTAADRPANVPASAARIGDVFIDCSVVESSRANRCAVYREGSGEIQVSGLFELSGAGREAKQTELRYMAFDGTRIWLQDARSLRPVLLLEYAVPGMASQLAALAGKDAQNCGRVTRSMTPDIASECASKAFGDSKPFYVSYDQNGWGAGYTVGFARDKNGNLSFVEYMNQGWPPQPPSEAVRVSEDNNIRFGSCPKPQILFKVRNGQLSCIGSTE
jgi:hypothetical protein